MPLDLVVAPFWWYFSTEHFRPNITFNSWGDRPQLIKNCTRPLLATMAELMQNYTGYFYL